MLSKDIEQLISPGTHNVQSNQLPFQGGSGAILTLGTPGSLTRDELHTLSGNRITILSSRFTGSRQLHRDQKLIPETVVAESQAKYSGPGSSTSSRTIFALVVALVILLLVVAPRLLARLLILRTRQTDKRT